MLGLGIRIPSNSGPSGGFVDTRLAAPAGLDVEVTGTAFEVTYSAVVGAASYEWRKDGTGAYTNVGNTTSFSGTAAAGSHTISVRAVDGSGVKGHLASHGFTIEAVSVVPVDLFVDFEHGTAGDIITPTDLQASTHSAAAGTWAYSNGQQGGVPTGSITAFNHTYIASANGDLREAVACNGTAFDGTGTRCLKFDMSAAANHVDYEGFTWSPSGTITGSFTISSRMKFTTSLGVDPSTSIDLMTLYFGGIFAAAQFHSPGGGTAGYIIAHGTDGSGSHNGGFIPVDADTWYDVTLHANVPGQRSEVCVQLAATGEIIDTAFGAFGASESDALTFALIWDYLVNGDGQIYHDNICMGWGANAVLPFGTVTVPDPEDLAVEQTDTDELRVTWTGKGIAYEIHRNVDSGGWTQLEAEFTGGLEYFDNDLSDGQSVEYRVRALVGSNASSFTTADAVTVTDTHAGFDVAWQSQVNNFQSANINTETDTAENVMSQKIKGIQTGTIGISKVRLYVSEVNRSEDVSVQICSTSDGTGTVYATSNAVTITDTGATDFEFFTPVEIPATTDFFLRIVGDWAIFSLETGLDAGGYRDGEGYDLLHGGTGIISGVLSDLRFIVYAKYTPVALGSVSRSQTASGTVTLSWADTNQGLARYRIDQYHGSYTDNVQETSQGATSAVISGLTNGEVYKWRVQAFIDGAVGSETSKVECSAITIDNAPYAVPTFTDAIAGASTNTSDTNPAAWRQAVVCGTTGNCTKLRMWCRTFNFAASVKMALYDSSNNLLGSGQAATVTTSAGSWVEVTLSSPVVVASGTTYKIGVTTSTAGLQLGYLSGTGNLYIDFTSFSSFPVDPWTGADNNASTAAVGMGVV